MQVAEALTPLQHLISIFESGNLVTLILVRLPTWAGFAVLGGVRHEGSVLLAVRGAHAHEPKDDWHLDVRSVNGRPSCADYDHNQPRPDSEVVWRLRPCGAQVSANGHLYFQQCIELGAEPRRQEMRGRNSCGVLMVWLPDWRLPFVAWSLPLGMSSK